MTLLFTTISYGQNVWYASALSGNDGDDGKSWANAKLTIESARDSISANYDTLLINGDFGAVDYISSDGPSVKYIIMDSTFHANQGWLWDITTPTDTTKMWGSEISTYDMQAAFTPYTQFWGIIFDWESENGVYGWNALSGTSPDSALWKWCKFTSRTLSSMNNGLRIKGGWELTYCLINPINAAKPLIFIEGVTRNWNVQHVTIVCSTAFAVTSFDVTTPSTNDRFRNNIIQALNDSAASGQVIMEHKEPDETINDIDYNIWFADDPDFPTEGGFEWDDITPAIDFESWRDSLQTGVKGIDPDGENNSQFTNPLLNDTDGAAYITQNSPAFNAASDKINNIGDIGYYQTGQSRTFHVRRRGLLRSQ